jgi:hypothetical protein
VIRDLFYKQIFEGLAGRLDGDLFEACASALLRKDFPTLVPIRGGTDSGMDGVTASPGPFLVCTTSPDVIGNLTKSLKSNLQSGSSRRSALLATSQKLTATRRTNLENRARELGFSLLQIYDRAAIADRLYYEPHWCKELLGLTGRPSALTAIPRTERPLLDLPLVGRAEDIKWLQGTSGDRLLVGQPGCGKTFLLRSLALEGWGLFLVDDDPGAIAVAVRAQRPRVIIVDDAHFKTQVLSSLRQLRSEIMADFEIVATSWDGDKDETVEALSLAGSQIHGLDLLTRDEIVEVIKHTGIGGPVELVREIVNQAEGRPGLAVTLSYLCLNGSAREVFYGEALSRTLGVTFQRLVGKEAKEILSAFALGGDQGMSMEVVAGVLGIPIAHLHASLVRLAAGGVIRERSKGHLSVWPRTLRYILVRDTFFSAKVNLPCDTLIESAPDKTDMAETLIGAISRGAEVPQIVELLEGIGSPTVWRDYASLGEAESKFVLRRHPEYLRTIGEVTLELAPEETLPLLLDAAVGDERELGHALDHPLRWVQDWIRKAPPGKNQAARRRKLLVRAVKRSVENGGDERVAFRALCLTLQPTFENYSADPGSGMRVNITSGLLTRDELTQLKELWGQVIELIANLRSFEWKELFGAIHPWAYPEMGRNKEIPSDVRQFMLSVATRMIEDVANISREHPGVQQWVSHLAGRLHVNIETTNDPDFEILFPDLDRSSWQEIEDRQRRVVPELITRWRALSPSETAARIVFLEQEATLAGKTWPRWTDLICSQLAEETSDPNSWLKEFAENGVPASAGEPFLRKTIAMRVPGWEEATAVCLNNPSYEIIALCVLLTLPEVPADLLAHAVERSAKYPQTVDLLCLRDQVPEDTLRLLLRHPHPAASAMAAVGTWNATPRGQIKESIAADWRGAIIRAEGIETWIAEILKSDSSLASEWLKSRLERRSGLTHLFVWEEVQAAISVLNFEQRKASLQHLEAHGNLDSMLIAELAGNDLQMYREILKYERLSKFHLSPLRGRPTGVWVEKALAALDAEYSNEQIANATLGYGDEWVGSESNMWQGWVDDFEALAAHPDPRIREIGQIGAAKAGERKGAAVASERREAVYGH